MKHIFTFIAVSFISVLFVCSCNKPLDEITLRTQYKPTYIYDFYLSFKTSNGTDILDGTNYLGDNECHLNIDFDGYEKYQSEIKYGIGFIRYNDSTAFLNINLHFLKQEVPFQNKMTFSLYWPSEFGDISTRVIETSWVEDTIPNGSPFSFPKCESITHNNHASSITIRNKLDFSSDYTNPFQMSYYADIILDLDTQ